MIDDEVRLLIVEARYYPGLADELLKGAGEAITAAGGEFDVMTVPGALEVPGVIAVAEEAGHRAAGVAYHGYVALGAVIRDEPYRFEIVANQSARGLMDLSISRRLSIGNGILTVENEEQAWAQARVSEGDRGGAAARACLDVIGIRRRLYGKVR